jgi:hypothetical protein
MGTIEDAKEYITDAFLEDTTAVSNCDALPGSRCNSFKSNKGRAIVAVMRGGTRVDEKTVSVMRGS